MSELIESVINSIQLINEKITGIETSPLLEDYPTSLDSLSLPCSLTDIVDGSQWQVDCPNNRVTLNVTVNILIERSEKGFYGPMRVKVANLSDNFRNKYLSGNTYMFDSGVDKKVILEGDGLKAAIAKQPFNYSGYIGNYNYPQGSTNFFHAFTVTFQVIGLGGGC